MKLEENEDLERHIQEMTEFFHKLSNMVAKHLSENWTVCIAYLKATMSWQLLSSQERRKISR